MKDTVTLSKRAEKSLRKSPKHVVVNFFYWQKEVETHGIEDVRKIPGYHDEPLEGKLRGYVRSFRLGLGYRGYYRINGTEVKCITVEEVNKHDYKKIERIFGL